MYWVGLQYWPVVVRLVRDVAIYRNGFHVEPQRLSTTEDITRAESDRRHSIPDINVELDLPKLLIHEIVYKMLECRVRSRNKWRENKTFSAWVDMVVFFFFFFFFFVLFCFVFFTASNAEPWLVSFRLSFVWVAQTTFIRVVPYKWCRFKCTKVSPDIFCFVNLNLCYVFMELYLIWVTGKDTGLKFKPEDQDTTEGVTLNIDREHRYNTLSLAKSANSYIMTWAILVKLATVVEGHPKAHFSIAFTSRCTGGLLSLDCSTLPLIHTL